nr:MAG TPA: hypothetical protein [Caudoviricetes sp.]
MILCSLLPDGSKILVHPRRKSVQDGNGNILPWKGILC